MGIERSVAVADQHADAGTVVVGDGGIETSVTVEIPRDHRMRRRADREVDRRCERAVADAT